MYKRFEIKFRDWSDVNNPNRKVYKTYQSRIFDMASKEEKKVAVEELSKLLRKNGHEQKDIISLKIVNSNMIIA